MAKQTEISINYAVGMKVAMPQNRFEMVQFHMSRSETYVLDDGDDPDEVYRTRFAALQKELGDLSVERFEMVKGGEI